MTRRRLIYDSSKFEVTLRLTVGQSVSQSVSMSWYRAPFWDLRPDITSCRNVAVWNLRYCRSRSYFTTDSQSACLGIEHPSGTCDQISLPAGMLLFEIRGLISLRGPLWREDGSAICGVITQWSESLRTRNHTLLSHLRLPQGQVPVFISPRNRAAQLYPRALGSLYVASYDSQGYGGGILTLPYLEGQVPLYMANRQALIYKTNANHRWELTFPQLQSPQMWGLTSIYTHCFMDSIAKNEILPEPKSSLKPQIVHWLLLVFLRHCLQ
jgi:hypothetical protein